MIRYCRIFALTFSFLVAVAVICRAESEPELEGKTRSSVDYEARGSDYFKAREFGLAVEEFTKAIKLDPKNALAYVGRGNAYQLLKQYRRAIEDFTTVIELIPKFPGIYKIRASAYHSLGEYGRAIADLTKAIELDNVFRH